jgi:hypothetical protein
LDGNSFSPVFEEVANAFDNDPTTKYLNRGGVNSGLEFAYAVPSRLSAFIITTANDVPDRDPTAYRIEGFSTGSWQTLHVGGLALPTARLTDSALVTLPELPLFTQYRIVFTALRGSGHMMQIADLKLFGSQSTQPGPVPPAPLPVVSLAVSPATVAEDGAANLTYTFTRTGSTAAALVVGYGIAGTAAQGTDYTIAGGATGTVTFAAGAATAAVTVDPTADTSVESDETVALTLAAGTGYTIGTAGAAVGTITNDDAPSTPAPLPGATTVWVFDFNADGSAPVDVTALPGYGVATSALFNFGGGGWAGWSVPAGKIVLGAKIISSGDTVADFSVFKAAGPNEVYPHWTYGPAEYGWVLQAKQINHGVQIEVYYADGVDLDVDSDNVGGVQRSAAEDAIEDITDKAGRGIDATPGLYLQVQDEDSDGDGLVNWADGFNGIGDELDIDDVSAGATFAPLWFQIPAWVYAPDATLEMIYSASDPSAAVMDPHYHSWDRPTDGHLRIWTKDAFLPRNRASIQDGGDYVAPTSRTARSYTLAELGLQPGDNRLFLEAIQESTTTAQQEITFRLTPRFAGQPAAFTLTDTVRATTARIEVLADNRDGTPAFPTFGLTATRMPNPNAGLSGLVPDITQAYTINVYDPRGPQTIQRVYVADKRLSLSQSSTARYTTPQFLAVPEEDLPLIAANLPVEGLLDGPLRPSDVIGQAIVVPVSGTMVHIRYNGETTLGLITKDAAEKAIALLRQVVTQVDARLGDFNPLKGNEGGDQGPGQYLREDPGAMGKEAETRIHNRFADIAKNHPNIKTRQLASQFRKGIVVDAMGIVKEVANKKDDVQLDLVFVRKGYEPVVGQPLARDSVIVIEVRSSLSGSLTKESLAAREALSARPVAVANFNWRYKQVADGVFEVAEHKRIKGLVVLLQKHGARILKVAPTVFSAGAFAVTNLNSKTYAKSEEIMNDMLSLRLDLDKHDPKNLNEFARLMREFIQNHFGDALELPTLMQVRSIMFQDDIGTAVIDQWIEVSKDMEYSTFNR